MRCSSSVTGLRIGSVRARTMPGMSMRAVRLSMSHSNSILVNCGSWMVSTTRRKIAKMVLGGLTFAGHDLENRVALLRRGPIGQDGLHVAAAMVQRTREEECRDDRDTVELHVTVVTLVDMQR